MAGLVAPSATTGLKPWFILGGLRGAEALFFHVISVWAVGDRFLLQEEFGGLHSPVGVEPALHNVVAEKIRER